MNQSKHTLKHIAYIMDGNGRWAKRQNKTRNFGHLKGIKVIPKVIEYAIDENIPYISLFAFSTENWSRPKKEVTYLINLLIKYANSATKDYLNKYDIKLNWIGFSDNLNSSLIKNINDIVNSTKNNKKITVNFFFNYSGIKDIENAFLKLQNNIKLSNKVNIKDFLLTKDLPPIDLLVRTGNEKRISNFALYDLAYTEIIFENVLWPDYNKSNFISNIKEYYNRNRRFGNIDEQ